MRDELHEHGPASLGVADHFGRTLLHHAALRGLNTCMSQLVECGADPAIRDVFGKTAAVGVPGVAVDPSRLPQDYLPSSNVAGRAALRGTANLDAVAQLSRLHSTRPISARDCL